MYRRGPKKSTPASVQCQKCLKRGHYTYECKASAQERPYVPRPSRTQQLFNPKLAPKLTNEAPPPLEKKEGLAGQILAQRESERARKRHFEGELDADETPKRQRSASFSSVSTVSTVSTNAGPSSRNARQRSSRSPSPGRGHAASRASRSRSPAGQEITARSASYVSGRSYIRDRSLSADRSARDRSFSPQRHIGTGGVRGRDQSPDHDQYYSRDASPGREPAYHIGTRRRRRSPSTSRSPPPQNRRRLRSRSPEQRGRRDSDIPRQRGRRSSSSPRHRGQDQAAVTGAREPLQRQAPRERSLSPFSRRLALTQSMNTSR
ncbi:zinc knuckle-domain-containing protein [Microdochium trichocladiopsis]|uniref:Zinc knuckle-domain-containing protein n=1 Tax=Microdochium trichocladiopsis TaxID=1682393 RepID=A0A9P9BQW3_9PEZI|nr:zinc knuckle-domain-containing protein [Microdochium trichocladiopsis]KAH7026292.1 zinc knuckle-domain-containing protein [Microdochium trichocladiopsis]